MKTPSAAQKRALAAAAEPFLSPLFRAYRRAFGLASPLAGSGLADPEAAKRVQKVLVVRLDAIGDLLLSEPALEVLRRRFPNARIDLVANPASAQVLRGNPNLDRLVTYRAPWHAAWRGTPVDWRLEVARFWGVTHALRRENYDVGFELRGDFRDILFLAAAGPRFLIGTGARGGSGLLDLDHPLAPQAHQVELSLAIASAGALPVLGRPPQVYLSQTDQERGKALLSTTGASPLIALHLGAGFPSKRLPLDKFTAVVCALLQWDERYRFVTVGGPEERTLAETLRASLQRHAPELGDSVLDLTGRLSLLETAAVLERCRLFIGNDSAPMHLAAAVSTPVVTFFGPSEPWKFHPYGAPYRLLEVDLECRPCDYVHCVWQGPLRYQCMTRQSVEAIVEAAKELLGQ